MRLITTRRKPTRDFIGSPVAKDRRNRKHATGFFLSASEQLEKERVKEARKLFQISCYYDPSFAPAHALLGMTHIIEDKNRQGIKHCVRAVQLGYVTLDVCTFLASAYGKLGDFEKMQSVISQAERFAGFKKKEKSDFYFSLFQHHWVRNQLNRAATVMEILLTVDSNCCHWGMYSRCCYKLGRYELSHKAADTALQLDPSSGEAFYLRGTAAICLSKYPEAMLDLMSAQQNGSAIGASHNFKLAAKGYLFESRH